MIERLTTVTELPVDSIQIAGRLRDVRPEGVETLKDAITARGFVGRITVRRSKDGDAVMDGAHRLTAMRELGKDMIPCDVFRCSNDEARLFELDGNLVGAKLNSLELAYFLAQRRAVFQKLNPEQKQGAAGALARWDATDTRSLAEIVAAERDMSQRNVYRIMAAGDCLTSDNYRRLASAARPITIKDLQELGKVSNDHERSFVIETLAEGKAPKAAAARKLWAAANGKAPPPVSPTDKAFLRLMDAWNRAPKAARARFLEECGAEVAAALGEVGTDD